MIAHDQPTCFPDTVVAAVSSRQDGTVLDRTLRNRHDPAIVENRRSICSQADIVYEHCVYQIITYNEDDTFDCIGEVDRPDTEGVHADVLYTETPGVGLFLPIADCVGTVMYDTRRNAIALAHIGRHASIAKTMQKTVEFFKQKGSVPSDLTIWMAPSVGKANYVLEHFDHMADEDWKHYASKESDGVHLDLTGYTAALAEKAGVPNANIHVSPVNTATDSNYFSHSQGDVSGRFAVVAQIR